MAATRALQKFYKAATELQFYTPDRGYTYHAPISKHKALTSLESTRTSRANSPIPDTASQTSLQPAGTKETQQQQQQQGNDDRAIATSFSLALQWGNEYMDENPLIGEPGALKLSSTSRQLKDQQDRTEASKTAQKEREKMNESARASIAATPTPAPAPIKTDLKKSSVSKGKSPISAVSDGGIKKAGRRKSMKPGTPGVGSPS
jgi:mediator of RNA polymerase II transcription subunit 6